MKKFLVVLLSFLCIFTFSGCKEKSNLNSLSKHLTNYEIALELNTNNMQASAKQKINYINNTGEILKNLKLHLYPQNFKEGATKTIISSTKLNEVLNFLKLSLLN